MKRGSVIKLKKVHPCGGKEWMVLMDGLDFRLRCLKCGREICMSREKLRRVIVRGGLQSKSSSSGEDKTEVL